MFKTILIAATLLLLVGCSENQQPAQAATTAPQPAKTLAPASEGTEMPDHLLVFFLNPNGQPCQMQNAILTQMADELAGKVQIRYVSTMNQSDMQIFYAYGIRGLPALMLADNSGKEIKRLPPGVKGAAEVRKLLSYIPGT